MRGGNVSVTTQTNAAVTTSMVSLEPKIWRNSAACRDTDPDLFFPVGQTGPAIDHIASAKAVCFTCDVRVECLEYSLMTNQDARVPSRVGVDADHALAVQILGHVGDETVLTDGDHDVFRAEDEAVQVGSAEAGSAPVHRDGGGDRLHGGGLRGVTPIQLVERLAPLFEEEGDLLP